MACLPAARANDTFTLKCDVQFYIDGRPSRAADSEMTYIFHVNPADRVVRSEEGTIWNLDKISDAQIKMSRGDREFVISRLDGSIESDTRVMPSGKAVQRKGFCEKARARF